MTILDLTTIKEHKEMVSQHLRTAEITVKQLVLRAVILPTSVKQALLMGPVGARQVMLGGRNIPMGML